MTQQFWIGGFHIDLSRNQITQNGESITLAPKALSVLSCLAKHQGEVVSQNELLDYVWHGTVVSPNTLQRSIAQLRKALGDDGKEQVYIKTHAKKGYSLECDVRWHSSIDLSTPTEISAPDSQEPAQKQRLTKAPFIGVAFALICAAVLIAFLFMPQKSSTTALNIEQIIPITATDNNEHSGIYTPDGQYVIFNRYSDQTCTNNIIAKHLGTQKEYQLTKTLDTYGPHSISKDGKTLVFVQSRACEKPVTQKNCYYLMQIDFEKALLEPQVPASMVECKNSVIRRPVWLNDGSIALMQREQLRWKIIRYDPKTQQTDMLYAVKEGNIVHYDYSIKNDLLGVIEKDQDSVFKVTKVQVEGEVLSRNTIKYPASIAKYKPVFPRFSRLNDLLVFSTGKQWFSLSFDGDITNISLPIDEPTSTPVVHPHLNRMLALKGHYDSDIVSLDIDDFSNIKADLTVSARSNVGESNGIIQPHGSILAFNSERSGHNQIWLLENTDLRQLSQLAVDASLREFFWAQDGKSILALVDGELFQFYLNGNQRAFAFAHPIQSLLYFDSEQNSALANVSVGGLSKYSTLDLKQQSFQVLNEKTVRWAKKTEQGQIIYMDHLDRFWQSGTMEDVLIDQLSKQGSDRQFAIHQSTLYGINDSLQLWSYHLDNRTFSLLGKLPESIDNISYANAKNLVFTQRISAQKELIEIYFEDI